MDERLKKYLNDEAEREANAIMAEVNSDPELRNVTAPEKIRERLFAQIRAYEAQKAYANLSDEDKELIELGRVYKRRRKWNKFIVLAAVLVLVLAFGSVSIGESGSVFCMISSFFGGNRQTQLNSEDVEPILYLVEEEMYEKIEEKYGFSPVKIVYRPEGVNFQEAMLGEEIQGANIIYGSEETADLVYIIRPNYRDSSLGMQIEDIEIQEYRIESEGIEFLIKQYLVEESKENRWTVQFEFQNVQYIMRINVREQSEIEKIIENLDFPK